MSNNEIEAAQQYMLELLYSQASDYLSSDHFQQQHDMAEATDGDESATIPREPLVRSHEERTQDPRSPHSSQQQVEDDEVTLDIKEMDRDYGDGALSPHCCIYKVPLILRHLNEKTYIPGVVSVGPIHYRDERLKDMERHKYKMFKKFIEEARSSSDDLFHLVKSLEPEVRDSYSKTVDLTKFTERQLAKLTLMDAGYIIQLFIMTYKIDELGNDDAKLLRPSLRPYVVEDLLLLENQLPFFVIKKLFNKAFPHNSRDSLPSFLELTCHYFDLLHVENLEPNDDDKIKHFTDLLRFSYLPRKIPLRRRTAEAGRHILKYNANALQEKGIKLEVSGSNCLLDMKFSRNTLEIPQIVVEARTKLLFLNMIALEQCHYLDRAYISDYVHILDCLIDTDKDVDLLVSKKIVTNYLGNSNKVASLFNGLGGDVPPWDFNSDYLDICKSLNAYFQDCWTEMKATLRRDYCRTPWKIVATIVAVVLLLLAVVQTIFSILQVVK